jgi:mono/diheme cytochrome c family protein
MNRMWTTTTGIVLGAFVLGAVAAPATPAASQSKPPDKAAQFDGAQLFRANCASCHGTSAQGDGPVAPLLRNRPSDLTQIAILNGGTFPAARIQRVIDGRDVGSHGAPEMPVWGEAFRTTPGGYTEESVRARIAALVKYLESIQRRLAQ